MLMQSLNLTFGYYFPGNSFVHNLDARVKIICAGLVLILINFLNSLACVYFLVVCCLVLFSVSAIPGRFISASLRPFIWLFILTVVLHVFSIGRSPDAVFELGSLYVSGKGVLDALVIGGRFLVILLFSVLLISTTSPQILAKVIIGWMSPLEKLRVPVNEIGLMIMIALRFLPVLQDEATRILEARKIRLAVLGGENRPGSRIKDFQEILFAIFVGVLRRSGELSLSMVSRGYGSVPAKKWVRMPDEQRNLKWLPVWLTLAGCLVVLFADRYLML